MTETETSRTHILRVMLTGKEHDRLSRLWHADGARRIPEIFNALNAQSPKGRMNHAENA